MAINDEREEEIKNAKNIYIIGVDFLCHYRYNIEGRKIFKVIGGKISDPIYRIYDDKNNIVKCIWRGFVFFSFEDMKNYCIERAREQRDYWDRELVESTETTEEDWMLIEIE